MSACVQWELKKFLKTWFPRVGVIGGLVVYYLAGLVVYSCMLLLLFWALGFWLIRGIGF